MKDLSYAAPIKLRMCFLMGKNTCLQNSHYYFRRAAQIPNW